MPTVTTFEALLSGATWNGFEVTSRPTFLTYSFDTAPASYASFLPPAFVGSFQSFSAAEQAIARDALKAWADISGLTLFEVPAGLGDIRFGIYDFALGPEDIEDSLGFAYEPLVFNFPDIAFDDDLGGDIFINVGEATFDTLVHEVGHALGLKHPFEGETTLDDAVDDVAHTVMSYNSSAGVATQLGSLDILAIQHLYGGPASDGTHDESWSWDAAALTLTQTDGANSDMILGVAVRDRIRSGAGDDYVFGRSGDDDIGGEDGADTLGGGLGADTLNGGGGNDVLNADPGNDLVDAGDGDDDVFGFSGNDTLTGGLGDDTMSAGSGRDRLAGGVGDDVLIVPDGASSVDGGDGFDELWLSPFSAASANLSYASITAGGGSYANIERIVLFGDANADTLTGGALPDVLVGASGGDSLVGTAADDILYGDGGADVIVAGEGDDYLDGDTGTDTLTGGDGDDVIVGWTGDDLLLPGGGADEIYGGTGVDTVDFSGESSALDLLVNSVRTIVGGAVEAMTEVENIIGTALSDSIIGDIGANRLFGGAGADTISGGEGANYLRGDEGNDSIAGSGSGFDDINGNMGDDTCVGAAGDDWVVGGRDNDSLAGGTGANLVYGNLGADTCDGREGDDIVRGGQENDSVSGGAGNDFISGDRGDDTMSGGAGADRFNSFGLTGIDRVLDFSRAEGDRVQLDPGTQYTVAQVGADTVISMSGGGQMILVGVAITSLTGDWIFGF